LIGGAEVHPTPEGLEVEYRDYAVDTAFALLNANRLVRDAIEKAGLAQAIATETRVEEFSDGPVDSQEALGSHVAEAIMRITSIMRECELLRLHIEAAGRHSEALHREVGDRMTATAADAHALQQLALELIQTLAELEAGSRG
jgi:hypothetical protein